jgi:HAD superfamily hydrolase (TIGR01509 family)
MSRIALLFDLDGTLVETDHLHLAAYGAVLAETGRSPLDLDEYRARVMGRPNAEVAATLFAGAPDAAALIDRKEALVRARLAAAVEPVAGVHDLLDWAEAEGAGLAVVTNAPRANAEAMLAAAGLAARLTELVIGDECARPKPDPLPYLEAMRRLGATPARAIAFEDSPSGLRAARASGAWVVGLTTALGPDALLRAGAHRAIRDFADPALGDALRTLKARAA